MSTAKNVNFRTISPVWLLFSIFLVLKLTGVVTWSWIAVFAPFWVPLLASGAFFVLAGVLLGLAKLIDKAHGKGRK